MTLRETGLTAAKLFGKATGIEAPITLFKEQRKAGQVNGEILAEMFLAPFIQYFAPAVLGAIRWIDSPDFGCRRISKPFSTNVIGAGLVLSSIAVDLAANVGTFIAGAGSPWLFLRFKTGVNLAINSVTDTFRSASERPQGLSRRGERQ